MNRFETGLRKASKKVAHIVHPNLTISNEAVKVLNKVLSEFNDQLIAECLKKKPKGDGVMREQVVQKAVEHLLKGQLRNLAIANAHRTLALHASGLLTYTPKALLQKKKKLRVPEEFTKCVAPLCTLVNPAVKIDKEAKDAVADMLFQMSKCLIQKAQMLAVEKGTLTADEVIKAVDFYMKPTMAKHAISEGTKNAALFMSGCHYYSQEDFTTKNR